ncbi:MAG: hypothetical protein NAG76_14790 [Candidatus Pristimantibacillus lignocellulolyticus]|uniref:Anti-bacteriophage protein A/HamA C-terminal domain-containing protein n=1 Tax=Candidatus Pristimantibacillus lignocellulolyticus TaxID=2994561 RepID=A0A9J6ZAN6_9BACL|nr:MAG: hypothetical protein NAG76_14790 [Candidatus Pristimantibacillus lignocellulolyticus]
MSLKITDIEKWLREDRSHTVDPNYYHLMLKEEPSDRALIIKQLKKLYYEAHEDYRRHFRSLMRYSLDPLNPSDEKDPAYGYPELLDMTTLKGYFGEVFGAIIAENFAPFNEKTWKVPAFFFRNHHQAFDALEKYKRTGKIKKATMGRTGDDCLAFVMDTKGSIKKVLFCEAKCSAAHKKTLVDDAYEKISDSMPIPVETLRIIDILEDYDDEESAKWVIALRQLYLEDKPSCERFDLISYICGQHPIKTKTWISNNKISPLYTGGRKLKVVESHLFDIDTFICEIYEKAVVSKP